MFFAKFAFIAAWMIQLFNFVMGVLAIGIVAWTTRSFLAFDMIIIFEIGSSIIFGVMEIEAGIFVMAI